MRNFKHRYEIRNELTIIFIDEKNYFTIDTEDLFKVLKYKWKIDKNGYVRNGTVGLLHRFLLSAPNDRVVDHISHNKLNNSKSNLRLCTESENSINRLTYQAGNRLGIRGVTMRDGKYHAKFTFSGETYDLGSFDTLSAAEDKIIDTRWKISRGFSEADNPSVNQELLELKKNKELALESNKIKLPKFTHECCFKKYSVVTHRELFKCFLHLPLSTKVKQVAFCITYRFKCPKCGRVTLITYEYNHDRQPIDVLKIRKTMYAITVLQALNHLLIKEIPLSNKYLGTTKKFVGYDRWYYGVPINVDMYKRKTLDGADAGIVFVDTQRMLNRIRHEAEHEFFLQRKAKEEELGIEYIDPKNKELLEVH